MSEDVVAMLLDLLGQVQLSGADPGLEAKATLLIKARAELTLAQSVGAQPRP